MKAVSLAVLVAFVFFTPANSLAQASPTPAPTSIPAPAVPAVPKDTPVFTAPPGWTSQPVAMAMSGFTMLSMWRAPAQFSAGDNLSLGFSVAPPGTSSSSLASYAAGIDAMFAKAFGPGNPIASHAEKLCGGNADGWYRENKIAFGALTFISEQTMIVGDSDLFEVTYTRLISEKEDPAARSSLDTLCVKPSASPA
jgi:hypothetical protein